MRLAGIARMPLLLALACGLALPAAAEGASYRFKVDISVTQTTDWAQTVRHPRIGGGYCGADRDVHYRYKGEGDGQLKLKVRGARVTFRNRSAFMQSTEVKVPGTVVADPSGYEITMAGTPDQGCDVPPPLQPPIGDRAGCNPLVRRPGTARTFLLVMRGRLQLTGGFSRRDKKPCPDPSLYTGLPGYAGRASRRDVDALIANKRVRSIELSASNRDRFGLKDLSSFGANSDVLEASGTGAASWKVKLTRIY